MKESLRRIFTNQKALLESFFSLSILNGLNVLLPLLTLPYILRVVGAANYGIYSYVYVIVQYLLILNTYGFDYSATKQIAQNRDNRTEINKIYNTVIACRLLLLLGGVILFAVLSPFLLGTHTKYLMFIMGMGIVLGDTFNPVWLFQGMEKMRYLTIVNFISKIVFTVLIFVLIREKDDFVFIILLNSCGFILSGIISTIIARKQFHIHFVKPKWIDMKSQYKEGLSIFGSTVGINLYRNANIFILNFFVSEASVGIYAAAEKVIKGLQMITVPIAQALFPHLGYKFKTQPLRQNLSMLWRVTKIYGSVLILEVIVTYFLASWLVVVICGEGFNEAVGIVRIMSFVILFGGLNYVLGMVGLVNLNKQKDFFLAVMISGAVSVMFLLSTISFLDIKSAALALVISEVVLFILIMISIKKLQNKS